MEKKKNLGILILVSLFPKEISVPSDMEILQA
jgi:hypothetical protein